MSTAMSADMDDVFNVELPAAPYPGLRPFGTGEWPVYFGRESIIDEIIDRLLQHRFLVVHGDSGCGKSSLVRAGVLPRLEQDTARGGARWRTCATTPGDEPLNNLASAISYLGGTEQRDARRLEIRRLLNCGRDGAAALADYVCREGDQNVCILIDQFEELFAHAHRHGSQQARLLIGQLVGLQKLTGTRPCVVLTMRSEYLGACAQFEGFAQTVNATQYLLPRMEHPDLLRAVREPATMYDGEITADLAERLIIDAGGSQDQLPLIQHGLMVLHRDCVPKGATTWRLTADDYRTPGGLGQLLSDHADEVMRSVEPGVVPGAESSRVVEDIFRALTDINADGQAIRHPQRLKDLVAITGADDMVVRRAVDAFRVEGVSFLRPYGTEPLVPDDYVDISHEALLRCWARIADPRDGWLIREFKNGLVWRSLLVQADSFDRDPSNVLSPATTEERKVWFARRTAAWSERYGGGWDRVLKLIDASVVARDRQMQQEVEDRSRAERARIQEEKAKLREQELNSNLAAALEKSRREKVFKYAAILSTILLFAAVYFAYSAYRDRSIAVQATAKAQQAADDADIKRRAAEESLESLKQVGGELAVLTQNTAVSPEANAWKQGINRVQQTIAQQVAALNTQIAPRIYIHIAEESQRDAARELEARIEQNQIDNAPVIVPGIQLIDSAPPYTLLRCFVAEDCGRYGPSLVAFINAQLDSPKVRLQDFSATYVVTKALRPQHFELYFARGPIALSRPSGPVGSQ